jgi:hypothetical protein
MCRVKTSIIYIVCYIRGIYPAKDEDRELSCNNFFYLCVALVLVQPVCFLGSASLGLGSVPPVLFFSSGIYS